MGDVEIAALPRAGELEIIAEPLGAPPGQRSTADVGAPAHEHAELAHAGRCFQIERSFTDIAALGREIPIVILEVPAHVGRQSSGYLILTGIRSPERAARALAIPTTHR